MDTVQQSIEMLQKNLEQLRNEITELEKFQFSKEDDIRNFHDRLKNANALFRGLNPLLKKEDSTELLNRFNTASSRVQAFREEMNVQKQKFIDQKKSVYKARIEEAEKMIDEHYQECLNILRQTSEWLKAGKVDMDYARKIVNDFSEESSAVRLGINDMDELWNMWKQVREKSNDGKKNIREVNFNLCKTEVASIEDTASNGDPYEAITAIMDLQKRLRTFDMGHDFSEEIKKMLNKIWDDANEKIKLKKVHLREERKRQQEEFKLKKQEWINKTKSALERFTQLVAKNSSIILQAEEQVEQLKEEKNSARSGAYNQRIDSWIEEKEKKISDIKKTNEELQAKIDKMINELKKAGDKESDKDTAKIVSTESENRSAEN